MENINNITPVNISDYESLFDTEIINNVTYRKISKSKLSEYIKNIEAELPYREEQSDTPHQDVNTIKSHLLEVATGKLMIVTLCIQSNSSKPTYLTTYSNWLIVGTRCLFVDDFIAKRIQPVCDIQDIVGIYLCFDDQLYLDLKWIHSYTEYLFDVVSIS